MGESQLSAADIVKATGLSRATVYRRLKKESAEEIMASAMPSEPAELPAEIAPPSEGESGGAFVAWARAVVWACEHINDAKITPKIAGNKLNFAMWQAAQDYQKDFLVRMMPEACRILDKDSGVSEETEMEEAERASIADLSELLEGALAEVGLSA